MGRKGENEMGGKKKMQEREKIARERGSEITRVEERERERERAK